MKIKDVLTKIGFVRNESNLSAREVSNLIDMSPQYVAKVESGNIVLTVEKLIKILEVCNFPIEKFFYYNPQDYEKDLEILELLKKMPSDKKEALIKFIKQN